MKRFLVVACSLVSLSGTAAVSADPTPAGGLSAAQIVERNVAARGGLEAWRTVGTLTMSGKMEAGGKKNTELPFVMKMKRSHKSRLEITFQEQNAVQVYDGVQGWKLRPYLGRNEVEPFTPAESKSAASAEDLDGPLVDYAAKGTRVELAGTEAVEGRNAYKLKLSMKDGTQRHVWIDAKSFLESKIDGEPRKLDGKLHKVAIYYRDFRKEGALTVPHVLETAVDGVKDAHKMTIERVVLNQPMDDALFGKPLLSMAKPVAGK